MLSARTMSIWRSMASCRPWRDRRQMSRHGLPICLRQILFRVSHVALCSWMYLKAWQLLCLLSWGCCVQVQAVSRRIHPDIWAVRLHAVPTDGFRSVDQTCRGRAMMPDHFLPVCSLYLL